MKNNARLIKQGLLVIGISAGLLSVASAESLRVSGPQAAYSQRSLANENLRAYAAPVRNTSATDKQINNQVIAVLGVDAMLSGQLEVATANGVVTLIGKLDTPSMIDRAVELVAHIDGVRRIDESAISIS